MNDRRASGVMRSAQARANPVSTRARAINWAIRSPYSRTHRKHKSRSTRDISEQHEQRPIVSIARGFSETAYPEQNPDIAAKAAGRAYER